MPLTQNNPPTIADGPGPSETTSERKIIHVQLQERSYDIIVARGSLNNLGLSIAHSVCGDNDGAGRIAALIVNPVIERHYGPALRGSLTSAGFEPVTLTIPAGETHKTLAAAQRCYEKLYEKAVDRRTVVVAAGGGVVGDIAGFVAASYQRGLPLVQVPTTLLAQVDSSVGGKVGVNFRAAKNLIGAFYQPSLVVVDTATLATLPPRERRSGLAEVIKYGAIADSDFFHKIAAETSGLLDLTSNFLQIAIARCCEIKARIVEQDERETGTLRATLNFGHTVGHALEALTKYRRYTHGEAIALGMVTAGLIGEQMEVTPGGVTDTLVQVLLNAGLEPRLDPQHNIDEIIRLLTLDKKSVGAMPRFVLLESLGHASSGHQVPDDVVRAALLKQTRLVTG